MTTLNMPELTVHLENGWHDKLHFKTIIKDENWKLSWMYENMLSCFSGVWLFATLWTIAPQFPWFMGFSRQEYWRGLPFSSPGDLPDPGIRPMILRSPALNAWSSHEKMYSSTLRKSWYRRTKSENLKPDRKLSHSK